MILEAVEARIVRAVYGVRHLQEVMTAFWFNHFNVFAGKGCEHLDRRLRTGGDPADMFGHFRDLLGATAKHPAMLFYLDNWQNTAPAPARGEFDGINENYAREVMELHTLGVNGGYTQNDVIELAHILTGWGLLKRGAWARQMDAPRCARGRIFQRGIFSRIRAVSSARSFSAVRALDQARAPRASNRNQYGFLFDPAGTTLLLRLSSGARSRAADRAGRAALDLLARSPVTANHLCYQLAQYFVADDPPPALVKRMAHRYLATDGTSARCWR